MTDHPTPPALTAAQMADARARALRVCEYPRGSVGLSRAEAYDLSAALITAQARIAALEGLRLEVEIALGELTGDIDQQAIERATGVVIPAIDRVVERLKDALESSKEVVK